MFEDEIERGSRAHGSVIVETLSDARAQLARREDAFQAKRASATLARLPKSRNFCMK